MATNLGSVTKTGGDDVTAAQNDLIRLDIIKNAGDYETAGGTGDVITLAIDAQYVAYAAGDIIRFQAAAANTGATTINVNALGAKTINKNHDVGLEAGDIENGMEVVLQYDGTNMQLQTPHASQMTTANSDTLTGGAVADALHLHFVSGRIGNDHTQTTHTGDVNETTMRTIQVDANDLGANDILRIRAIGSYTEVAGTQMTVKIKYGGTTFLTSTALTNGDTWAAELDIHARNATNAQASIGRFITQTQGLTLGNLVTGVVDSTSNQNVIITFQLTNNADTGTLEAIYVELVKTTN